MDADPGVHPGGEACEGHAADGHHPRLRDGARGEDRGHEPLPRGLGGDQRLRAAGGGARGSPFRRHKHPGHPASLLYPAGSDGPRVPLHGQGVEAPSRGRHGRGGFQFEGEPTGGLSGVLPGGAMAEAVGAAEAGYAVRDEPGAALRAAVAGRGQGGDAPDAGVDGDGGRDGLPAVSDPRGAARGQDRPEEGVLPASTRGVSGHSAVGAVSGSRVSGAGGFAGGDSAGRRAIERELHVLHHHVLGDCAPREAGTMVRRGGVAEHLHDPGVSGGGIALGAGVDGGSSVVPGATGAAGRDAVAGLDTGHPSPV